MLLPQARCWHNLLALPTLLALLAISLFFPASAQCQPPSLATPQPPSADSSANRVDLEHSQRHFGLDQACADTTSPACSWGPPVRIDTFVGGPVWFRGDVTLPPALQALPQIAVLEQGIGNDYSIYANGHLVSQLAPAHRYLTPYYCRNTFLIPSSLAENGIIHFTVLMRSRTGRNLLSQVQLVLAPPASIQDIADAESFHYFRFHAFHFLCFTAIACGAVVFVLLYAVNPKLTDYLCLAFILGLTASLRIPEVGLMLDLGLPTWVIMQIWGFGNSLTGVVMLEFVHRFLGRPIPWYFRVVQITACADIYIGLGLPLPASLIALEPARITAICVFLASLSFFLMLPTCFRAPQPEMRWIGAASLLYAIQNSSRMAAQLSLPALPQDLPLHINGYDINLDIRGLTLLLFAIVMLIAMTFRLRRIQDRNRQVEQEIAAARSVQQILIPDQLPSIPGLTIESAYLPAQEVGGDFFQVLPLPSSESAFVVLGDVSGKGLKAAMTVSLLVGALRNAAAHCTSPAQLLAEVNQSLVGRSEGFATCLALLVTPSGHITVANAGHPSPYLNGQEIETAPNLPLGLVPEITYSETTLQVLPGQRLTLVTDGVVEATSTTHELFGFDRTQSISIQPAASIAQAAQNFSLGAPQADDITVLTLALA